MHHWRFGLVGVCASLVFILAACGSSSGTATTSSGSSIGTTEATSTVTAIGSPSAFGSPTTGMGSGTPMASPSASMSGPVNLATAYSNLKSQNSYVMTAKLANLQGTFASIPGITAQSTLKIERSGNDQHLTVTSNDGKTTFQIWQVNDQVWADIGSGPVKVSKSNSVLGQFIAMISADQQIVSALDSKDATYQITGIDKVNGMQANVETSQYLMAQSANSSMFFSHDGGATVNSKIWVSQTGSYLLQGDFTINANGSASSPAGSAMLGTPMSATPGANGSAVVMISVTQIGQVQSIQPPS